MSDIFFGEDDDAFLDEEDQMSQKLDNISSNRQQMEWGIMDKNQSLSIRSSQKNKYIKKIKDIAPEISLKSMEKNQISFSHQTIDKKQRNKFSAKQSRDRKKLYIQIMQQKQRKLQQQLSSKRKELEQTKSYLQRVVNQNQIMSNFTTGRHQMIKKLQSLVEKKNQPNTEQEINVVLDNLRYRIGATGKERINTINEYFRQIVNLSLPALHRYMMWSASEEKHMFSKDETQDDWFRQLKEKINLSFQQKKHIQAKQGKLKQQKQLLASLIQSLRIVKNHIENKSIQLEDMIDHIRQILTPIQCAQFILFIERNKYRKQLNLCDIGDQNTIKKQIKLE